MMADRLSAEGEAAQMTRKRVAISNEILRGIVGSTAHGTAVEGTDDRDENGRLSFELRAAKSLARLWRHHGKRQQAHDLLAPVYKRFLATPWRPSPPTHLEPAKMANKNIPSDSENDKALMREVAATHEAGHIAVALEYKIEVIEASIEGGDLKQPSATGRYGGYTNFVGSVRGIRDAERMAIAMLAGREAEALYFREPLPEGSDELDIQDVERVLLMVPQRAFIEHPRGSNTRITIKDFLPIRIERLRKLTRQLVRTPLVHYRIHRLREELLKRRHLDQAEIDIIARGG
jgi:hypothetical protein